MTILYNGYTYDPTPILTPAESAQARVKAIDTEFRGMIHLMEDRIANKFYKEFPECMRSDTARVLELQGELTEALLWANNLEENIKSVKGGK